MRGRSASLLPWIVAFKALKAILLTALGVAALSTIHRDPVDVVVRVALAVHLPVTSRVFDRAVTLALRATPKREVAVAMTAFATHSCWGWKASVCTYAAPGPGGSLSAQRAL